MQDTVRQAVSAITFGVSFFLLWLSFATLFLAFVIKLSRNGDAHHVFGLRNKSAVKGLDVTIKTWSDYFSTKIGRIHAIIFGTLLVTTVLLGFWSLIENNSRRISSHQNGSIASTAR